jgi:hypothetical protein
MIIFNPKQIAIAASERKVGKKLYLFGIVIFVALVATNLIQIFIAFMELFSVVELRAIVILIFQCTLTLAPLTIAYIANKKGDGRDFLYRLININTPITLSLLLFALIFGFIVSLTYYGIFGVPLIVPPTSSRIDYIFNFSITAIGSIALYYYMKLASQRDTIKPK